MRKDATGRKGRANTACPCGDCVIRAQVALVGLVPGGRARAALHTVWLLVLVTLVRLFTAADFLLTERREGDRA